MDEKFRIWDELNKLNVYKNSMELGEALWPVIGDWNWFLKKCIGDQIIRSADSIAANIAEGYGRYSYREKLHFYYYARASWLETATWLEKARARNLLANEAYYRIKSLLDSIPRELHILIQNTRNQLTH